MIGKKRLATIKSGLQKTLAAEGVDPAWFDPQLRKLSKQAKPRTTEIETLIMVRDALAEAVRSSTRRRTRTLRVRSRASPSA